MKRPMLLLLPSMCVAACSGPDRTPADQSSDTSGGSATSSGGGNTGDGGTSSSAGGEAANSTGGGKSASGGSESVDDQPLQSPELQIDVYSSVIRSIDTGQVRQLLQAHWYGGLPTVLDEGCEILVVGDCEATICPKAVTSDDSNEVPHAGTIDASIQTEEPITARIAPDELGDYVAADFSTPGRVLGGELGTVSATGGDISAFTIEVMVPLLLLNTVPSNEEGYILADRASSLKLSWERGVLGTYYFVQTGFVPNETEVSSRLTCRFPSEHGEGTIDTSLLQMIPVQSTLDTFTVGFHDKFVDGKLVRVRTIIPTADLEKTTTVCIELE